MSRCTYTGRCFTRVHAWDAVNDDLKYLTGYGGQREPTQAQVELRDAIDALYHQRLSIAAIVEIGRLAKAIERCVNGMDAWDRLTK